MKANAIIRIVIYGLVIGILLLILAGGLGYDLYFSNGRLSRNDTPVPTEGALVVNQQDVSAQIQNIEIEWAAGSITIHKSDSLDSIRIEEASINDSKHEMVCRQVGQTLKIQYSEEKMSLIGIHDSTYLSKDLVIRVPKNWNCNDLEIDAAAADITIQDLTIREFDFDGASGNLILDNCNVSELDIDTASGDVEFIGDLEKLDFDAASAEFYGEFHSIPRSLNMDSMSGDMELVLPPNAGFTCYIDGLSNNFSSDFELSNTGGTYVHGDGLCRIDVSCVSGDVNILKGIE